MKKFTKACLGLGAIVALVGTGILAVNAWGPERPSFTMEHPADHVVFNSITNNNQEVGDERYFVSASEFTGHADQNVWRDTTEVEAGKEYVVRMYVHNDAAANFNLTAVNTKAFVILPTETASAITINGKISADNANPKVVWDQTTLKSKNGEKFNLAYVKGSAKYHNTKNGQLRTFNLDTPNNDLFTKKGVLLGYDKMDGNFPGCIQYSGYVTFHVKPQFSAKPALTVQKEVKLLGEKQYGERLKAKSGDTVRYRIEVKNTGNVENKNVLVRDVLPKDLSYVKGSTKVANSNQPNGVTVSDNIVSGTGINIGDYAPNANAFIFFDAKVNADVSDRCEDTLIHNVAQASAGFGTQEDGADVLVDGKICEDEPAPKPGFTLHKTVQLKGGKDWRETVTAQAGEEVRFRIQFRNTGNSELQNVVIRDLLPNHLQYKAGTTVLYDAQNPSGKTLGDQLVSASGINLGSYAPDAELTLYFYAVVDGGLKDSCEDVKMTNVADGRYNNDGKTAKRDDAVVTVAGKTCVTPTPPTPPTPPAYPVTGADDILSACVGLAGLTVAGAYYMASRKIC